MTLRQLLSEWLFIRCCCFVSWRGRGKSQLGGKFRNKKITGFFSAHFFLSHPFQFVAVKVQTFLLPFPPFWHWSQNAFLLFINLQAIKEYEAKHKSVGNAIKAENAESAEEERCKKRERVKRGNGKGRKNVVIAKKFKEKYLSYPKI